MSTATLLCFVCIIGAACCHVLRYRLVWEKNGNGVNITGEVNDTPFIQYFEKNDSFRHAKWVNTILKTDPAYLNKTKKGFLRMIEQMNITVPDIRHKNSSISTMEQIIGCGLWHTGRQSYYVKHQYPHDFTYMKYESKLPHEGNLSPDAEDCIEWLKYYYKVGQRVFMRLEPPKVNVTVENSTKSNDTVILMCTITGFYPKEIEVSFVKDGINYNDRTVFDPIVRNDTSGTFSARRWRELYDDEKVDDWQCKVEHDSYDYPIYSKVGEEEENGIPEKTFPSEYTTYKELKEEDNNEDRQLLDEASYSQESTADGD